MTCIEDCSTLLLMIHLLAPNYNIQKGCSFFVAGDLSVYATSDSSHSAVCTVFPQKHQEMFHLTAGLQVMWMCSASLQPL